MVDTAMGDVPNADVEMEDDKITTKEGTEALAQLDAAEEITLEREIAERAN